MSGQGASMAMTGAYVLANQLAKNPNSFETACRNYQDIIQPNIVIKQALAEQISHEYVPENKLGIIRRSYFTRRFFKNMYEATLTLPE